VVWLVIGTHTLLILWTVRNDEVLAPVEVHPAARLELTWIPPDFGQPGEAAAPARPQRPRAPGRQPSGNRPAATPAELPAVTVPTTAPAPDWRAAAERAARRATTVDPGQPQDFAATPASPYRDCQRKPNNFEWKPDAHRTGWANGLPYVRAGKRCVIGLGFFGCKLDPELPPPDGELFEDMNTTNQMDGTVPGSQDCVAPVPPPPPP